MDLSQLLKGEGFTVEYKKCSSSLSNSVFETVCSFSNRYGGHILLGVDDDATVIGVNEDSVSKIKKDFINTLNNPTKIRPSLFLNLEEIEYENKTILWVYVPVSSEVEYCDNRIYDRNGDADQDITKSTDLVANLFSRKSHTFYERQIFPYVTTDHLRLDLIPIVKRLALLKNEQHPWKDMDEMELFKSAGLYEDNFLTGQKGFNLAAVLLFGKDTVIQSCLSAYRTDAIFRDKNPDRYDDRLIVETNLIEAYDLLIQFIQKHTDDRFFLQDNISTSIRDSIAREVVTNMLVHREYASAFPAKIIITKEMLYTENWNRATTFGRLIPGKFTPYPKNPLIAKFFMQIGRADTLGSGVYNLYKFTKIYSNCEPTLEESDVFKTTIPLIQKEQETINVSQNVLQNVPQNVPQNTELKDYIFELIKHNPKITRQNIAEILNINIKTVARKLKELPNVHYIGSAKNGHWEIF